MDTLTIDEPAPGIEAAADIDATPSTIEEVDALYDAINPNHLHFNPDDYEDDTAYLEAIPGMADYLLAARRLPRSAFKPVPRKFFNV